MFILTWSTLISYIVFVSSSIFLLHHWSTIWLLTLFFGLLTNLVPRTLQLIHLSLTRMLTLYSDLELKPQGKITLTVVRANDLKNMEMIGKSDPYVVVYIRPLFKVKTKVIDNNLNPIWDQTFELIAEDKETQSIVFEVISPSLILFFSFQAWWFLLLCTP